jgi:hemoglobin
MADSARKVYEQIGEDGFARLVDGFYRRVAGDPVLRPMYPAGDLGPAERRLRLFLAKSVVTRACGCGTRHFR